MFNGKNMSKAARQAAKAQGLSKVGKYEVISNYQMIDYDDPKGNVIVIRAYSPMGNKVVDITAEQVYYFKSVMQDAPMARV
jgi:hypothetical protein